jgi:chromosome partitioning protein
MAGKHTRIVAVANEKGGVGKTATVVNLGAALSLEGWNVLIVDMDPQHNTTSGLGIDVEDDSLSVYDLITNGAEYAAKEAICATQWEKLHLLPSHIDLSGAEIELVDEAGRENRLREVVSQVADDYDAIIMDTPPSLSLLTINVFAAASELVVPCQTHPYAYKALEDLFDTISDIREEINPDIRISGIVPTFFDQRTKISRDILERLQTDDRYKDLLYDTAIRVNTTITDSCDQGRPVVFYRRSSYGARDYMALAREFMAR